MAVLSIKSSWQDILKRKKKKLRRKKRKTNIKRLTDEQKDMVEWNEEDWQPLTTQGGRYAPKAVKDSLTDNQRKYESAKKRAGKKKGKQHVPRGKTAKKVYRRVEGR